MIMFHKLFNLFNLQKLRYILNSSNKSILNKIRIFNQNKFINKKYLPLNYY